MKNNIKDKRFKSLIENCAILNYDTKFDNKMLTISYSLKNELCDEDRIYKIDKMYFDEMNIRIDKMEEYFIDTVLKDNEKVISGKNMEKFRNFFYEFIEEWYKKRDWTIKNSILYKGNVDFEFKDTFKYESVKSKRELKNRYIGIYQKVNTHNATRKSWFKRNERSIISIVTGIVGIVFAFFNKDAVWNFFRDLF